jgi:hypothetical protein
MASTCDGATPPTLTPLQTNPFLPGPRPPERGRKAAPLLQTPPLPPPQLPSRHSTPISNGTI